MKIKMRTPWGDAQSVKEVRPGILSVSTAGHGGYKLDRSRNARVHEAWRVKGGWYEEDCKWAIVVFTFRGEFPESDVKQAIGSLKGWEPDAYMTVTGETVRVDESHVLQKRAALDAAKGKLIATVAWGSWHSRVPEGMVGVAAKIGGREGSGAARFFLVPEGAYSARGCGLSGIGFVFEDGMYQEVECIQ